jgi:hypothetical protein
MGPATVDPFVTRAILEDVSLAASDQNPQIPPIPKPKQRGEQGCYSPLDRAERRAAT